MSQALEKWLLAPYFSHNRSTSLKVARSTIDHGSIEFLSERDCMPIYEYECPECGRFEVIQKFSDKTLTHCPNCKEKGKKNPVQKAVSASAFHLKGSRVCGGASGLEV